MFCFVFLFLVKARQTIGLPFLDFNETSDAIIYLS